jgi:RHS repeat-associated protein
MMKNILSILILTLLASTSQAIKFVTYYAYDQVGNPVAAIDETQGIMATRDTLAYGSEQIHTGNAAAFGDLGFTGQIDRSNNQIVYFNARYYLPQLRRFASPDSVTVVDGGFKHIDRYSYAYANPYLYNDPTGNTPAHFLAGTIGFGMGFFGTMFADDWNWSDAFTNGGIGAGVGAATLGLGLAHVLAISTAGSAVTEVYNNKGFDLGADNLFNIAMNGAAGVVGGKFGQNLMSRFRHSDQLGVYSFGSKAGVYSRGHLYSTAAGTATSGLYTGFSSYAFGDTSTNYGYSYSDSNYTYLSSYDSGYGGSSIMFNNDGYYSAGFDWGN